MNKSYLSPSMIYHLEPHYSKIKIDLTRSHVPRGQSSVLVLCCIQTQETKKDLVKDYYKQFVVDALWKLVGSENPDPRFKLFLPNAKLPNLRDRKRMRHWYAFRATPYFPLLTVLRWLRKPNTTEMLFTLNPSVKTSSIPMAGFIRENKRSKWQRVNHHVVPLPWLKQNTLPLDRMIQIVQRTASNELESFYEQDLSS